MQQLNGKNFVEMTKQVARLAAHPKNGGKERAKFVPRGGKRGAKRLEKRGLFAYNGYCGTLCKQSQYSLQYEEQRRERT